MLLSFGQVPNNILCDTLLNIIKNQGYDCSINYTIIQAINLAEDGGLLDSGRKIIILSDTNKAIIRLPIPDEEVKNFAIDEIREIHNGFAISTSYGGTPCFIRRIFKFKIDDRQIYLQKIISHYKYDDSIISRKIVKRIHPKMVISEIDLTTYLVP